MNISRTMVELIKVCSGEVKRKTVSTEESIALFA